MIDLTERQLQLLKAIVEEYIETAEPVGSEKLDKKFNLGVSPATIRNEMIRLTQMGYLKQPHVSAGRQPTSQALKLYVSKLMKPEDISVAEEVKVKQNIANYKDEMDKLLREATKSLANHSKAMSLAATDEGDLYTSGVGNILEMPEFYDIDLTKHLLDTLDEFPFWWDIFSPYFSLPDPLAILMGEDLKNRALLSCGGVFIRFGSPAHQGAIGVIGPCRLDYQRIIPMVRYMGNIINEIAVDW